MVVVDSFSDEKFLVWSWKMTYRNLSQKPLLVTIDFKLTDSNNSVLADNTVSNKRVFQLDPGETETFSDIVESPLYAKQASRATWKYWAN